MSSSILFSKHTSNGAACIVAVSEKSSVSIFAAGFSERRKAQRIKAVLMKME
jgi:hypothetical protein